MRILPRPIGALILIAIAAAAYFGYERVWHRHPSRVAEAPKPVAEPPLPPRRQPPLRRLEHRRNRRRSNRPRA